MNDYKQPAFYRFNQDSISLVNYVLQNTLAAKRILDLGAGSGVIGLEVARILNPELLHSLEVQDEYKASLQENMDYFLPKESNGKIEINSFGNFVPIGSYDLILCNPPYYFSDSGQRASDQRREIARSFTIDNWEVLFILVKRSLAKDGSAYFVLKNETNSLKRILSFLPDGIKHKITESGDIVFLILS